MFLSLTRMHRRCSSEASLQIHHLIFPAADRFDDNRRNRHRRACRAEKAHGNLRQSLAPLPSKERLHQDSETDTETSQPESLSRGSWSKSAELAARARRTVAGDSPSMLDARDTQSHPQRHHHPCAPVSNSSTEMCGMNCKLCDVVRWREKNWSNRSAAYRSRRPAPLRRRENSKRATDQHQKRSVAYALDRPRRHFHTELIPCGRNRVATTYKANARDSSAAVDQLSCFRCSCNTDSQHSNQAGDAA